jgi:tetratricopeptide (TPR) repeat protein
MELLVSVAKDRKRAASHLRQCVATCRRFISAATILLALSLTSGVRAEASVKGRVKAFTDRGYARLVFQFDEVVESAARISGSIMVIDFKKPVDLSVEHLNEEARDFISAARLDPDGTAIRIALSRPLKLNTIPAAERFYVDLLPESWTGILPGLPQEVIDELAQRAQKAEEKLHEKRREAKNRPPQPIEVKVARQQTFIRYVFSIPESVDVVPARAKDKFTLSFDQKIKWDLSDALSTLPPSLISITNRIDDESSTITFHFNGSPEMHTFREDRSFVVDVVTGPNQAKQTSQVELAKQAAALKAAAGSEKAMAAKDEIDIASPPKMMKKDETPQMTSPASGSPPVNAEAKMSSPASAASDEKRPMAAIGEPVNAMTSEMKPDSESTAPMEAPIASSASRNVDEVTPVKDKMPAPNPNGAIVPRLRQSANKVQLEFPFLTKTPAAVFRRADTIWLVFDSAAPIDVSALINANLPSVRKVESERSADGAAVIRISLNRPQLASVSTQGTVWTITIADTVTTPTRPLSVLRSPAARTHGSIAIPLDHPESLHELHDPEVGDRLFVVTALAPARGLLKQQDFVELRTLPSAHGVVIDPIADDVAAVLQSDRITISRPKGLSLSLNSSQDGNSDYRAMTFDTQRWVLDRTAPFVARQSELILRAAAAPENNRRTVRLELARFYLARGMEAEAKGVIDVALADEHGAKDVTGSILKAVANVMLDRPGQALKDLARPEIRTQQDAPVWRAVALAREGNWPEARKAFKRLDDIIADLPIELQRFVLQEELRTYIKTRDFTNAIRVLNVFQSIGITTEYAASIQVLSGQLNEGLGRKDEALTDYRAAAVNDNRRSAAQGRLREIELTAGQGSMPRDDLIKALETLSTVWRGDETEAEALKLLAHLYTRDGRYRDSFHVMRTALLAHPNSDLTRQIQDEAATTFDNLFLGGKGDAMSPVQALGLFYDFRELTPIGRRGDEMIRRLADRLVSVDLLDQAEELLQHQVDHRLKGGARAQVASKLAIVQLMNRKPSRALATLQSTRTSGLSNELRNERLLLEARALSEQGRHDVALDIISEFPGREAMRLRSDIMWAARRWRSAAEEIEKLYGQRWRDFAPLNEVERSDILRAAIGYALDDETIGLARLRDKYGAKMADGPDRRAFDVVSAPIGTSAAEFQEVAKRIATTNTLEAFLRDMRERYPDLNLVAPVATSKPMIKPAKTVKPQASLDGSLTGKSAFVIGGKQRALSSSPLPETPPAGVTLTRDSVFTGSIPARSRLLSAEGH